MNDVIRSGLIIHEQIKLRLVRDVLNPETADEEFIKSDRLCAFGVWIYHPDNERLHGDAAYQSFKAAHKQFHVASHQALCLAKCGQCKSALDFIETGPFETASASLKKSLVVLRRHLSCD